MNFFQHKMIKSGFFRYYNVPIDMKSFPGNKISFQRHQFDTITGQSRHFAVVKDEHIPSMLENCRNIGSDKVLSFTHSNNERTRKSYSKFYAAAIFG